MCKHGNCGCKTKSAAPPEAVAPRRYHPAAEILGRNSLQGKKLNSELEEMNIFTINIMGSAGAGKTSLLEALLPCLGKEHRAGVIEGDLFTRRDANRIAKLDVPVVQVNTSGGCHLTAAQVAKSLPSLPLKEINLLFIENVGNLVCPAGFSLGENIKIVVISVTEGDDKPAKYPLMFIQADIIVLNKTDLLEASGFNLQSFYLDVRNLNGHAPVFEVSCRTGSGLDSLAGHISRLAAPVVAAHG